MTTAELLVLLQDLRMGASAEERKLERKREWPALKTEDEKREFVCTLCAIANSPGGGGFLIVGLDNDGTVRSNPILSTGMDPREFHDCVVRYCEPPFDLDLVEHNVENKIITVIEIPKSSNRPHLMKVFRSAQNFVPVRKSAGRFAASRQDLDEMYTDRPATKSAAMPKSEVIGDRIYWGNSVPEGVTKQPNQSVLRCRVQVTNVGAAPTTLTTGWLQVEFPPDHRFAGKTVRSKLVAWLDAEGGKWQIPPQVRLLDGGSVIGSAIFLSDESLVESDRQHVPAQVTFQIAIRDTGGRGQHSAGTMIIQPKG